MRARAASPFPEPFMQYKETQMNTRGFSLVREERLSEVSGTVKLWRHDATGAELLSIVNNDENKCFGATFRHPPERLHRRSISLNTPSSAARKNTR